MTVYKQAPNPKILVKRYDTFETYWIFSPSSSSTSGRNLLSYSFSRATKDLSGTFSFTLKEDNVSFSVDPNTKKSNGSYFLDTVQPLDIIEIYEDENAEADFIGYICNISFGAVAGNLNKTISISGKSISGLFDLFKISLDLQNMVAVIADDKQNSKGTLAGSWNTAFQTALNNGTNAKPINELVETILSFFVAIARGNEALSNLTTYKIIENYYAIKDTGRTIKADDKTVNILTIENSDIQKTDGLFPIVENAIGQTTMKFIEYVKNLLPENVYEIFDTMENGHSKLVIRELPYYDNLSKGKYWFALKENVLDPALMTNFTFTLSNDQIYTVFMSYLEGSTLSAEKYLIFNSTAKGYKSAAVNEKRKLYGYNPLTLKFVGYNPLSSATVENGKVKEKIEVLEENTTERLSNLNEKVADWYGNLDEMYTGDVTIVNLLKNKKDNPKIGERVSLCGGTFYITAETHTWQYNSSPTINYQLDRGGIYSKEHGFKKLTNISKPYAEMTEKTV